MEQAKSFFPSGHCFTRPRSGRFRVQRAPQVPAEPSRPFPGPSIRVSQLPPPRKPLRPPASLSHSPSRVTRALKRTANFRPGTQSPRPVQERPHCPRQCNPGRGWVQILKSDTRQPYSPCRAQVGKKEREVLWERESSVGTLIFQMIQHKLFHFSF